mgnify:CR=1 FL=1
MLCGEACGARLRICWGINGMFVAGDGPRELPLVGCLFFFIVSKSGAFTGPFTVADVILALVGNVSEVPSRALLDNFDGFATGWADAYPGVLGSADNSAGSGSGLASGGVALNNDNRESWWRFLGFGCSGTKLGPTGGD